MSNLADLASRMDDFNRRLKSIADNEGLSPAGQTSAVALLTVMRAGLFVQVADALRKARGDLVDPLEQVRS